MPFVALNSDSGKRISILDHPKPRDTLGGLPLCCPLCKSPMHVVSGIIRIPHFRHTSECSSSLAHHAESPEHILGKKIAVSFLKGELGYGDGWSIDFEVPMPDLGRVADLTVTDSLGLVTVGEVQLASITTEQLAARSKSYTDKGMDVWWFLGGSADTPANGQWCNKNLFGVAHLNFILETTTSVFNG